MANKNIVGTGSLQRCLTDSTSSFSRFQFYVHKVVDRTCYSSTYGNGSWVVVVCFPLQNSKRYAGFTVGLVVGNSRNSCFFLST